MSELFTGHFDYPQWWMDKPDGSSFTVREVARRMNVTPITVIRWIEKGLLKAEQPGGPFAKYSIPKEDMGKLLKSGSVIPDWSKKLKETLSCPGAQNPKAIRERKPGVSASGKMWGELTDQITSMRELIERMDARMDRLEKTLGATGDSRPSRIKVVKKAS